MPQYVFFAKTNLKYSREGPVPFLLPDRILKSDFAYKISEVSQERHPRDPSSRFFDAVPIFPHVFAHWGSLLGSFLLLYLMSKDKIKGAQKTAKSADLMTGHTIDVF